MNSLHIITPVKDSIDSTLETIQAVLSSRLVPPHTYTVYNDFSTPENTAKLEQAANEMGFKLVNLSDLTSHPSPNYLLVLQRERRACLEKDAALLIVESDVIVKSDRAKSLTATSIAPSAARCSQPNCCARWILTSWTTARTGST